MGMNSRSSISDRFLPAERVSLVQNATCPVVEWNCQRCSQSV